jgi:predicted acyltransferase
MSLDAYRGFIMLVMASSGLGFAIINHRQDTAGLAGTLASLGNRPLEAAAWLFRPSGSQIVAPGPVWSFLGFQFDHVAWEGCAFWDLIQPSFMFMVGVALPFSFAARAARGDSWTQQFLHAIWRSALLVLLGVFLSSPQYVPRELQPYTGPLTNWIFPNVLCQIGLGYLVLFLLSGHGWKVQLATIAVIAVGYTLFFGLWPLPPEGFDTRTVGVPLDFPQYTGWFAHWNKNTNAAHHFDVWFLNLFPRVEPFKFNAGGYQTLNFVPSLITMILGLMAGEMLRTEWTKSTKFGLLLLASALCLGIGWLMGMYVCPIVKRIWTPSWAVYSAGWTFLILVGFFAVLDVLEWRGWEWALVVVGMNSIAMYIMSQIFRGFVRSRLTMHVGSWAFESIYAPLIMDVLILLVLWLVCVWMYRNKIFLRI